MTQLDERPTTLDFGGLRIAYDARVLVPRPWTVAQSEWAADLIGDAPPGGVLELCAGAGHIGLLAVTRAPRRLVAVDVDPAACDFIRFNAQAAGVRVDVREGDMSEVLDPEECFAVVVADPPWVPGAETDRFPDDPTLAIDGGQDGLDLVRKCLEVADHHLVALGSMVLQAGPEQADEVRRLVESEHPRLEVIEVRSFPRGTLLRIDAVV